MKKISLGIILLTQLLVVASAVDLPDAGTTASSPLHTFEIAFENLQESFASTEDGIDLSIDHAKERLAEAQDALAAGDIDAAETALHECKDELEGISGDIDDLAQDIPEEDLQELINLETDILEVQLAAEETIATATDEQKAALSDEHAELIGAVEDTTTVIDVQEDTETQEIIDLGQTEEQVGELIETYEEETGLTEVREDYIEFSLDAAKEELTAWEHELDEREAAGEEVPEGAETMINTAEANIREFEKVIAQGTLTEEVFEAAVDARDDALHVGEVLEANVDVDFKTVGDDVNIVVTQEEEQFIIPTEDKTQEEVVAEISELTGISQEASLDHLRAESKVLVEDYQQGNTEDLPDGFGPQHLDAFVVGSLTYKATGLPSSEFTVMVEGKEVTINPHGLDRAQLAALVAAKTGVDVVTIEGSFRDMERKTAELYGYKAPEFTDEHVGPITQGFKPNFERMEEAEKAAYAAYISSGGDPRAAQDAFAAAGGYTTTFYSNTGSDIGFFKPPAESGTTYQPYFTAAHEGMAASQTYQAYQTYVASGGQTTGTFSEGTFTDQSGSTWTQSSTGTWTSPTGETNTMTMGTMDTGGMSQPSGDMGSSEPAPAPTGAAVTSSSGGGMFALWASLFS